MRSRTPYGLSGMRGHADYYCCENTSTPEVLVTENVLRCKIPYGRTSASLHGDGVLPVLARDASYRSRAIIRSIGEHQTPTVTKFQTFVFFTVFYQFYNIFVLLCRKVVPFRKTPICNNHAARRGSRLFSSPPPNARMYDRAVHGWREME